jgi:hypothetical protein
MAPDFAEVFGRIWTAYGYGVVATIAIGVAFTFGFVLMSELRERRRFEQRDKFVD